ncbi:MAG: virulence RhuM family protein [Clostridia bacterium]|nr:virulence RhuM family protein [Clostridia bacterium]
MSTNDNQLVLFNSSDGMISLPVAVKNDSVWLTLDQISELFDRDKSTVSRHIHNVYRENELDTSSTVAKIATVQLEGTREIERTLEYYNLDVIISVGYRVKSQRGVEFRRWANSVLKQYILQGYAVNELRLKQLGSTVKLLKRVTS